MLHLALLATVAALSDSSNARWHARPDVPVQVFVSASSTAPEWKPDYVRAVRRAFREWNALGLPVQFAFTDDSTRAAIHVTWTDRFDAMSGRTTTVMHDSVRIVEASVVMAVHHPDGRRLGAGEMRVLAMHEVGHALGLDHVADEASIMSATVRVRELSARDRAMALERYRARPTQ